MNNEGIDKMGEDKVIEILLSIREDLGSLKQDMASSIRQRATLFEEIKEVRGELGVFRGELNAHISDEMELVTLVTDLRKEVDEIKPTVNLIRDPKTKGLAVLTGIALLGGSAGANAEKLLNLFLGR